MMNGEWHDMWMGFGGIWMILLWVLVILAVVWLVRYLLAGGERDRERPREALRILEERYARGEIDREEFELKKRDLGA